MKPPRTILAIETSCDETAAAVVRSGRDVLSSVISSQIDVHAATGGVVPEVAARLQLETIIPVIRQSLKNAGIKWADVDAIAVTQGPGLVGPLLVGVETAKALAYGRSIPLIPVNHLAGHLYACLSEEDPFRFPYLGLIVSGGHTELVLMKSHRQFRLIGSTRDDAAGEAMDKVGKLLGLPYPGGPHLSALAKQGNPELIELPRAMLDQENYDFSFSGLKTAARQAIGREKLTKKRKADLAASFETAVVDSLVRKTVQAARQYRPEAVLLGGGVSANQPLRKAMAAGLQDTGSALLAAPLAMTTDNAAMIGLAADWYGTPIQGKELFTVTADPSLPFASGN